MARQLGKLRGLIGLLHKANACASTSGAELINIPTTQQTRRLSSWLQSSVGAASAVPTALLTSPAGSIAHHQELFTMLPIGMMSYAAVGMRNYAANASSDKDTAKADEAAAGGAESSTSTSSTDSTGAQQSAGEEAHASVEELLSAIKEKEEAMSKLNAQVEKLTEAVKRSLADMENLRARTAKEVDNAKKFALQGFVKALLDVVDNLERASGAVPANVLSDEPTDPEKLRASLKGLLEGVQATEAIMLKVLKQHGVTRYDPLNEKFDPNLHSALFEVPDPSKEAGIVAHVTKRGYMLNDRIVRPAEVGVYKN